MDGSLVIMACSFLLRFCYSNGLQPCHYGRQFVLQIFVTPIDGRLAIMEGSLLSRFLFLQWLLALSLQKVVFHCDFRHSNGLQPYHYGRQSVVHIFVTPMDGNHVIMECSLFSRFLLLQWILALSLWKLVCCSDFCYSNGWLPFHYGRQIGRAHV